VSDNGVSAGPRLDDRVIVLFGGNGDLARRKLLPGLFHLPRSRPAAARVPASSVRRRRRSR
jgi:glucose-6-phosphate 1-dehydrogenase